MCGIAGWIGPRFSVERLAAVRRAMDALAHRGPDDAGLLVVGAGGAAYLDAGGGRTTPLPATGREPAGAAIVGHRRLAIIDRSADARQPMVTPDGRFVLVLNGEIYNYVELREELAAGGYRFRSASDTEVLLAAFARWGAACLDRLIGMFAFVVVDLAAGTAFLARDAFGMKPLYYAACADGLAFASEIGPLLELAASARRLDPGPLLDYLDRNVSDHGDRTLVAEVRQLPAAHHASVPLARPVPAEPVRWWAPSLETTNDLSMTEAASELRDRFLEGLRLHLRSDVRVGTLLSGGLDSSAIVMAMRALGGPSLDIHTFSYLPGPGAISEQRWIDDVNRAAQAVAHPVRLEPADWARDADLLAAVQELPFGSPAVYAQFRLFGDARASGVGVVLDGQGADELMGGYRSMWVDRLVSLIRAGRWREAGRFWRRAGRLRFPGDPGPARLARSVLTRVGPGPWVQQWWRRRPRRPGPLRWEWFRRRGIERLPVRTGKGPLALREALWHAVSGGSLPGLLRFEDRGSMAHAVEARLPFLTRGLAEFALSLPEEYLVAEDGTGKAVFREAMRGLVPSSVLDRRDKVGFAVPLGTWLPQLPGIAASLEAAAAFPFLDGNVVRGLARRVRAGVTLTGAELFLAWRLVGLEGSARRLALRAD